MAHVKDLVCGMTIDSDLASSRMDVDGRTYYFCSVECRTTFSAHPDRYIGDRARPTAEAEPLEQHEPPYTTLGFLTSPKFGAAGSGGLEYERLPEAHDRDRP